MNNSVLSSQQIILSLVELPNWRVGKLNDCDCLIREIDDISPQQIKLLKQKIKIISDQQNHHPDYPDSKQPKSSGLTVAIYTHSQRGITEKDLELALEIEKLINN